MDETDRFVVQKYQMILGRLVTVDACSKIPLNGLGGEFVIPPARHMRFCQPMREQREVNSLGSPERDDVHRLQSYANTPLDAGPVWPSFNG